MKTMSKKLPAWLVLTVICIVAAVLLAGTNLMTKTVIADNANRKMMETLGTLLPEATKFEELGSGVTLGKDADGNPVGYTKVAVTQGFGGEIEITVAAQPDGAIAGISVGGSNFAETAGLGARAKEPEFQAQFVGKTAPVALTKDGGQIDALSGATITSRAVIRGVNEAMEALAAEAGFALGEAPEPPAGGAAGHALAAEKGTGITVIPATEWESKFPDVYASYQANAEEQEVVEYTEQYPFLKTVYEGYGFASYYGSARGHYYAISDLLATGRPHALANCFTCKTAQFSAMVLNEGDSVYSRAFESIDPTGFDDVGCFTCHANNPGGQITVTHSYLVDALGEDFERVEQNNLACGQCHVEYYFAPEGKATSLPYHSLADMTPDAMYDFYTEMDFADWEHPRTGVRMLKAQHPEMETLLGAGSVHGGTFTCADCHMEKRTNEAGETYWSHQYVSPLKSEIIQQNCIACHADLPGFVHGIQDKMEARTIAIGENLALLSDRLAERVASGKYTDEDLAEIRELNRKGQWYWDFVFVENSEGAHNSRLDNECLDKAEELIQSALEKVEALDV